jgi:taurine dioxygenase
VELEPITGVFGAEVLGVDLSSDPDDKTISALSEAYLEYKVLVFPNQHRLRASSFARFASRFGGLEAHPFYPPAADEPLVAVLDSKGTGVREAAWHSDVTWQEIPSDGSMLRAIDIPPYGRDTAFADMEAVYAGFSIPLRKILDGLSAVHDFRSVKRFDEAHKGSISEDDGSTPDFPPVEHPVVRTHPVTGRKSLFVNPVFTKGIVGMRPTESDALLRLLYEEVHHPEYQLRVRWRPGTVAWWDNRCTQHALIMDSDYPRLMERVQLAGTERPR